MVFKTSNFMEKSQLKTKLWLRRQPERLAELILFRQIVPSNRNTAGRVPPSVCFLLALSFPSMKAGIKSDPE